MSALRAKDEIGFRPKATELSRCIEISGIAAEIDLVVSDTVRALKLEGQPPLLYSYLNAWEVDWITQSAAKISVSGLEHRLPNGTVYIVAEHLESAFGSINVSSLDPSLSEEDVIFFCHDYHDPDPMRDMRQCWLSDLKSHTMQPRNNVYRELERMEEALRDCLDCLAVIRRNLK